MSEAAARPVKLLYKPDFEEARRRWDAFWAGEIIGRPCLHVVVPKEGAERRPGPAQLAGLQMPFRQAAEMFDAHAATHHYLAEAVPFFRPGFGPDQFAAFFGTDLRFSEASGDTNWAVPFVEDWDAVMPLRIRDDNKYWRDLLEFYRVSAEVSDGKFILSHMDIHSNMDCLLAIRTGQKLCLDLIERPETIDRAMKQVRAWFAPVYDAVYEAGRMQRGTIGWTPFYCRDRFATIQCDFVCMISPAMSRRFVIPALEEEAAFLDHCVYHFDGPGAIPHLDDICGIKDIDVIQWVQGAGSADHVGWIELLQRFQSKGKGLEVHGTPEQVKVLHRALRPEKVLYCVGGLKTRQAAEELIGWFERNT